MYEELKGLIEGKLEKGQKLISFSPIGGDDKKKYALVLSEIFYKGREYFDLRYFSYSDTHSGFMKNGIRLRKEHRGNAYTLLEVHEREEE